MQHMSQRISLLSNGLAQYSERGDPKAESPSLPEEDGERAAVRAAAGQRF